jgi:hypothetical protein
MNEYWDFLDKVFCKGSKMKNHYTPPTEKYDPGTG